MTGYRHLGAQNGSIPYRRSRLGGARCGHRTKCGGCRAAISGAGVTHPGGNDHHKRDGTGNVNLYTISVVGDNAGPRNIFASASSDHDVWTWKGGFPEFYSFGQAETMTVTFSAPVPVSDVVFGVNSTSASTAHVTLSGGTATLSDINLSDSLQAYTGPTGAALYNSGTGVVTASGQNQSLMLGSTSGDTITSLTYAAGASDGGADGYTVFVGFRQSRNRRPSYPGERTFLPCGHPWPIAPFRSLSRSSPARRRAEAAAARRVAAVSRLFVPKTVDVSDGILWSAILLKFRNRGQQAIPASDNA